MIKAKKTKEVIFDFRKHQEAPLSRGTQWNTSEDVKLSISSAVPVHFLQTPVYGVDAVNQRAAGVLGNLLPELLQGSWRV